MDSIKQAPPDFLKGHFLMAMPGLNDPNFNRSVTCISEHTPDGAVGMVINRTFKGLNAKIIFQELGIALSGDADKIPIHIGGPVHHNELFVLHDVPLDWENSLMINDHLALSNSREILEAIAQERGPRAFVIALGCAGWAPGQLEQEMQQNCWLSTPCSNDIIFNMPVEERWKNAIRLLGIDPDLLTDTAGHA